jgi:hypothetical protein
MPDHYNVQRVLGPFPNQTLRFIGSERFPVDGTEANELRYPCINMIQNRGLSTSAVVAYNNAKVVDARHNRTTRRSVTASRTGLVPPPNSPFMRDRDDVAVSSRLSSPINPP